MCSLFGVLTHPLPSLRAMGIEEGVEQQVPQCPQLTPWHFHPSQLRGQKTP